MHINLDALKIGQMGKAILYYLEACYSHLGM